MSAAGDAISEIQRGLFALLTGVSPVIAGDRIYDHPPQTVTFPFVHIFEIVAEEHDVDLSDGTIHSVLFDVYSRETGKKEALEIASQIKQALHKEIVSVSGRNAIAWWDGTNTFEDADGITQRVQVRIRVHARS